ncbi:MAG: DUF1638 domain-containing protein [Phycisphaeraceae bacterium]|nr:DUF1638 domain-containing protein [Phycisphaeraceae bacterium]
MSIPQQDAEHQTMPRIAVISCAVMDTEVEHFAAQLDQVVHVAFLEQGLHNEPDRLRRELQQMIDHVEQTTDADAIVLVYGLCSRGTEGVRTRRCKLVIARAHDCITLLLGDKDRYAQYVKEHPDTYWYSPGWNKHHTPPGKARYDKLYKQYTEQFGEDEAQYLMVTEQHWFQTYGRAAYVHLTVGRTGEDVQFTKDCADWLNWDYDEQDGDAQLLIDLLSGEWDDERFVVLEPGRAFEFVPDERVIEPADPAGPI